MAERQLIVHGIRREGEEDEQQQQQQQRGLFGSEAKSMSNLGLLGGKRSRGGVSQTCGACRGTQSAHVRKSPPERPLLELETFRWWYGQRECWGVLGGVGGGLGASAMSLIDGGGGGGGGGSSRRPESRSAISPQRWWNRF